jgi:ABC-2 type transport system permease protein
MDAQLFKGTGQITRLILRQERFKIIIWLVSLVSVTLAAASSYSDIYPDEHARQAFALTMENPAMITMLGLGYAIEDYVLSIGTLFAHEMLLFTAIAVAIMNILLVGRSTRADEEDGRVEMVRSLPVGRLSYLTAALIVVLLTNLLLALLTGIGLTALAMDGVDMKGSLLYGSILGATGLIFAMIAALFAQLAETARGTTMLSFSFLIVVYLVRGIGDVSNETLSLLSPLGWTVRTGVFVDNHLWPVLLTLVVSLVIGAIAFYLHAIRDLEAGFIPQRKGKRHASPFLLSPLGLSMRLQSTMIMAWAIGLFLLGASFGSILGDLETYYSDMEIMQAFLANDPNLSMTDQFVGLLMAIMSLISCIPALLTILKLKTEESKNRTEHFFSRAVSRTFVMGNYYFLAIVVGFVMQSLVAIGLWSVGASVMDETVTFTTTFSSAMVYLPAMLFIIGLAVLVVGALPRAAGLVWFYLVYCFIVVYLSSLLDFPEWMNKLSVFEHIPQIPVEDMQAIPMIMITVLSIALAIMGFTFYNKRDISG